MQRYFFPVLLLIAATVSPGIAGDIKVEVQKKAVIVAPVKPGVVSISAPPGSVLGMFPIQIVAKNKKTEMIVTGIVAQDGSFSVEMAALPKDKIKLTFISANGKDKNVTVKIPKTIFLQPLVSPERSLQSDVITVPQGTNVRSDTSSQDEIIEREKELQHTGIIE
jgi:hypothetical protein